MIRHGEETWPCDGCGEPATRSCGHGNPLCDDCPGTGVCGACVVEASEAAAEAMA